MAENHLKNIAIVGASGNVGASALKHLLAANNFNITIVTRSDSTATFPNHSSVTIKKGIYADPIFLSSAFDNQDAVVLALGFMAMAEQPALIEAVAKAGVKWILPTEYSADGLNKDFMDAVPLYKNKVAAIQQIDELANEKQYDGLKWIGVATNPWTELSLVYKLFGIDIPGKRITLYEDAGQFNTTTISQVGLGITRLLSLPIANLENPRASLAHYANNFVYISSFLTTQKELFEAVLRATGSLETDWTIERTTIDGPGGRIEKGWEEMKKGNFLGGADMSYGYYMGDGRGGNYEEKARVDREVLGLVEEDIEEVVERVVDQLSGT